MSRITAEQMRREFPVADTCAYLDNAYRGPLPARAAAAIAGYVERWSTRPFPDGRTDAQLEWAESVRGKVARLLDVSSDEILFSRSTTDALYLVASSLLKAGDELLVGGLDHPADYAAWLRLAAKGVKTTVVPGRGGRIALESLANAIGPGTRAIALCLVNTYNGYRQDLSELGTLCRERDLYLLLDAIQAMGHLKIDAKGAGVTAMSAGAYKWFCAPEGLGIAFINKNVVDKIIPETVHFYRVIPGEHGWAGLMGRVFRSAQESSGTWSLDPSLLSYPDSARRLELSANFLSLAGLEATVDLFAEFGGMAAIERRVLSLTSYLRSAVQEHGHRVLSVLDADHASGITSVQVPDARKFAEYCQKRGVWVLAQWSPVPDAQAVRVSPHVYNDERDIDAFVDALDSFTAGRP